MFKKFLKFFFFAYFLFATYSHALAAPSANPPLREPSAPVITVAPLQYYPLDDNFYLEGKADPKARIEILLERQAGGVQPIRLTSNANSNGEWYIAQKLEIASGEWTVRARAIGDEISDWSNPRLITSRVSGFVFGSLKVRYLPIAAGLAFAIVASATLLLYAVFRVKAVRRIELEKSMQEKTVAFEKALREKEKEAAAVLVAEEFADLKRGIAEELSHFDQKLQAGDALSKKEMDHRASLLRDLNRVEGAIEKKVKDIG